MLPLPKDAARLGKGFGKGRLGRDATGLGAIALAGSAGLSGAGAQEPLAEMCSSMGPVLKENEKKHV